MIRTLPEVLQLQDDEPEHAAAAREAGWLIEEDYWWVRPLKPTDVEGEPDDGFCSDNFVFVANAEEALAFDRGERGT